TVADAPVIVRGRIASSYVEWGKGDDGNRRIYTYYELQPEEVLKGKVAGGALLFRELGGEKDGRGMEVSGASHFEPGEEVVVMLGERNDEGNHDIRGLMMGKLNVRSNGSGKEILEGPALGGSKAEWTLQGLRQLVQENAAEPEGKAAERNAISPSTRPPTRSDAPVPTASQLQNPETEIAQSGEIPADSRDAGHLTWPALALLGGAGIAWGLFRRRRR
ncbi:MAG: hypothetical protein NDJ89_16530, partial [Oligoflexia bacterium]|nr:hypothetical protein [Oligoflexia bacterium]